MLTNVLVARVKMEANAQIPQEDTDVNVLVAGLQEGIVMKVSVVRDAKEGRGVWSSTDFTLFLFLFILNAAPAECIVNTKLSEANRASGVLRSSFLKCDNRHLPTVGKWHQFVGDAGTKIPNSCVPTNRCGSHAPGWMQGEHPKKEDGVVTRKVCFHWSGNCCRWSVMIKVRNCGGHYVYKLEKPPACYLRYCGDKGHSK